MKKIDELEKKLNDLIQEHHCINGMHRFEYSCGSFEFHEGGMVTMETEHGTIVVDDDTKYEVYRYCKHCKIAYGVTKKEDSSNTLVNHGYVHVLRKRVHK